MRYETPAAFRMALETRLATSARETGIDLDRLRRRVVFERVLARLAAAGAGAWVLKGGMALEVRWRDRARSTRDLDLASSADVDDADSLRRLLDAALQSDPHGDWFRFVLRGTRGLSSDEAGRPAWRTPIEATLAGRRFANVTVDVVLRTAEIGKTERLPVPNTLAFAGVAPTEIDVVDRGQHFAEKIHALTRSYGDRPNTRVKDLADLTMLIEDGLPPSLDLSHAVRRLFAARGTHEVPVELADPPPSWDLRYAEIAASLEICAKTLGAAMRQLRSFWAKVISHEEM